MFLADTWKLTSFPDRPTDWPSTSQWPGVWPRVWFRPWGDVRIAVSHSLAGDMAKPTQIYRFADFEVDVRARQLRKHGTKIKLHGQPFQMLLMLLEPAGEVVSREQMQEKLWRADTFVDFEHSLNTSIKRLRQALNDSATEPRFIETLPRVGYRFIAPVTSDAGGEVVTDPAAHTLQSPSPASGIPGTTDEASSPRHSFAWFLGLALSGVAIAGVLVAANLGRTRDRLAGIFRPSKNAASVSATAKKTRRSVAVLPLENLSADPSQSYFADGMTDELTTDLAQFADLRVISRTSAMHYKDGNKTAPQIGKELGVDALVEGSVERVGDRVRIRAQLIDCATDRHLWAQSYDREMKDVLSMQTEAAKEIAEQIRGSVSPPATLRETNPVPVDPEAYEAYLKGRYFWNKRTPDGLNKSIEYFGQAISKAPSFAEAYAGLADAYSLLGSDVLPADVANSKARANAAKAIELDPNIAEGHAALALVEFYYDWNWKQSEEEFRRAIELNPNYATAHQWYGYYLTAMLRFPEAVEQAEAAQQIDPLSLSINTTLASRYRHAGRMDDAIRLNQRTLEMDPNFIPAHFSLAGVYEDQQNWPQALEEYKKVIAVSPSDPTGLAGAGFVYARLGQKDEARKIIAQLVEISKKHYVSSLQVASVFAGLGDASSAMLWLEKAYQQRESQMPFLSSDDHFESLHQDPRYQNLLKRMNLPSPSN
jgi:TolB-like protein/DNA-binding winged helix-turn-helix (wHTH) protein/lipopolysaccharide biosynthesis regulator YciM